MSQRLLLALLLGVAALSCSSERTADGESDPIPNRHVRPIVDEGGKTLLWANEDDDGNVQWFDMTAATIDPDRFQYGIGKDTIASVDDPQFVSPDDPLLAERGVSGKTRVLGVSLEGESRAYPVAVMNVHEVVNDRFGERAYAVLW